MLDATGSTLQFTGRQKRQGISVKIGYYTDTDFWETPKKDNDTVCDDRCHLIIIIVATPINQQLIFWISSKMTSVRAKMNLSVSMAILCILIIALPPEMTYARPTNQLLSRQKRLSDQRLAELETLLALQKLKGIVVTVPVGYGKVNPALLGRKRRSILGDDFQQLQRLLLFIAQDAKSNPDENNRTHPSLWKEDSQEEQRDYPLI